MILRMVLVIMINLVTHFMCTSDTCNRFKTSLWIRKLSLEGQCVRAQIDGLVQERHHSIAYALELRLLTLTHRYAPDAVISIPLHNLHHDVHSSIPLR